MAKKENPPLEEISQAVNIEQVATSENIQVDEIKNLLEQLKTELEKFGLKIVEIGDKPKKIKIEPLKNIQESPADFWVKKLRVELAKLGLKIIEDIDNRRVSKPDETYNSLVALYNAVKN